MRGFRINSLYIKRQLYLTDLFSIVLSWCGLIFQCVPSACSSTVACRVVIRPSRPSLSMSCTKLVIFQQLSCRFLYNSFSEWPDKAGDVSLTYYKSHWQMNESEVKLRGRTCFLNLLTHARSCSGIVWGLYV